MKDLFNRSFSARDRLKRAEAYSGARRALKRPKVSSLPRWIYGPFFYWGRFHCQGHAFRIHDRR